MVLMCFQKQVEPTVPVVGKKCTALLSWMDLIVLHYHGLLVAIDWQTTCLAVTEKPAERYGGKSRFGRPTHSGYVVSALGGTTFRATPQF